MNQSKKKGCKRLLELLGADPNEPAPANLAEARDLANFDDHRTQPVLCPVSGKHAFSSAGAARQAINHRLRKGANTSRLRSYLCPDCRQWHLSSSFHS